MLGVQIFTYSRKALRALRCCAAASAGAGAVPGTAMQAAGGLARPRGVGPAAAAAGAPGAVIGCG